MANEISFSAALTATLSGQSVSGSASKTVTIAGDAIFASVQSIPATTGEQLVITDIVTPGYMYLKNLSTTETVLIDLASPPESATAFITLLPGEFAFFPTRQTTIYAESQSATPANLQIVCTEL